MEEAGQGTRGRRHSLDAAHIPAAEARAHLDRLLDSALFVSSGQLSKLLRYLVEETLAGRGEQLEAHAIAIDGLDKRQSFDPTIDTIVRTTLHRLRQRLSEYYGSAGKQELFEIRILKRTYIPQFRRREAVNKQGQDAGSDTVSHYRIIEKIGEGGMGTVYKAVDLNLGRFVALKFLSDNECSRAACRERLNREARAAALIEHPNVCPVFDVCEDRDRCFVVSAFVEGESLERRIARGPLPIIDALEIAEQLARGLAAAHRRDVIHCDIKPSNVIVGDAESGGRMAKIIDFGIARARKSTEEMATMVTGTLAYMSPEQARGDPPDLRTDLWALGVVLFEMVAGRTPFRNGTARELRHTILEDEPEPLSGAAPSVPIELEWIVEKALAKEPNERYQNAVDFAVDLGTLYRKVIAGRTTTGASAIRARRSGLPRTWVIAVSMALAIIGVTASFWLSRDATIRGPAFSFTIPIDGVVRTPAISPESRYLAYVCESRQGAPWKLMVHDFRRDKTHELAEVANISRPSWSPDGMSIAFWSSDRLLAIPRLGGATTEICTVPQGMYTGSAWTPDGEWIYFGAGRPPLLHRVRAAGGQPEALGDDRTELEESPPCFLGGSSDNPTLLYAVREDSGSKLVRHDIAENRVRVVQADAAHPVIAGDYVFYGLRTENWPIGPLLAAPIIQKPFRLARNRIQVHPSVNGVSAAKDGTLVYVETDSAVQRVKWFDRLGRTMGEFGGPREWIDRPQISPDGKWVAVGARVEGEKDIWLESARQPVSRRLTFAEGPENPIGWSSTKGGLVYYVNRDSVRIVLVASPGENSDAVEIYRHSTAIPEDLSSDGRFLLLRTPSEETISYVQLDSGRETAELVPLVHPRGRNRAAEFSPDDRYVAYASTETGRNEIYVQAFPSGRNWMISESGGKQVRWNPNGRELFYVQGDALVSVAVRPGPSFLVGQTTILFRNPNLQTQYDEPVYDVSPDGQRFSIIERTTGSKTVLRVISNSADTFADLTQ